MDKLQKVSRPVKVSVTAQFKKSGRITSEEASNNVIGVLEFETAHVASVSAKYGVTLNMGGYEACRFDAMVTLPCYVEEIDHAMAFAAKKAEEYVREQASKMLDKKSENSDEG